MDLEELSSRVSRSATVSCPGGIGNFGFNSYDLLTFSLLVMGAVSSAVIVNTNKNENNDNNNDLEASFGQVNTNNQMASSDQTNTNMAIITVPPTGTPVVVPGGRMLSNGSMIFLPETRIPGVSWESKTFKVYDNGTVIDKISKETFKGTIAFGTIDEKNMFHRLNNNISWASLRGTNKARSTEVPPVIPFDDTPVFVPVDEIDELFRESVLENGLSLVQIAIPKVSPPIVLPIGAVLEDGRVFLNTGMEVRGAYWESPDRILYENGTIIYKVTETRENSEVVFATMDFEGRLSFLPKLGPYPASLSTFRDMNVRPLTRNLQLTLGDFAMNEDTWTSIRQNYPRDQGRRKKRSALNMKYNMMLQALSLVEIISTHNEKHHLLGQNILCRAVLKVHDTSLDEIIENRKPEVKCFYESMLKKMNRRRRPQPSPALKPPPVLYSPSDSLKLLRHLSQSGSNSYTKPKKPKTTKPPPQPVLWFPDNNADCGGSTKGGSSIGTFSLIALMLSIFNIINLAASNINNNNNRNNLNDNSGNLNTADNSESNANSGSDTATMVMLVPPGVGRRKRDADILEVSKLHLNFTHLNLVNPVEEITSTRLPDQISDDFLNEIPLGILVTLNSYHLFESFNSKSDFTCHERNFCELGLNCATFGSGSKFACKFGVETIVRWVADYVESEKCYLEAFEAGANLENCETLYGELCPVHHWNQFISDTKSKLLQCSAVNSDII